MTDFVGSPLEALRSLKSGRGDRVGERYGDKEEGKELGTGFGMLVYKMRKVCFKIKERF